MKLPDRTARSSSRALLHHVNYDCLIEAFFNLKKDAAAGVDSVTWRDYEQDLEASIADLHDRIHRGAYRAKPSLPSVYEQDFLGYSYGFRPGRSPHQALDALSVAIIDKRVNWVLDADIEGFFDTIDHEWLIQFLEHPPG